MLRVRMTTSSSTLVQQIRPFRLHLQASDRAYSRFFQTLSRACPSCSAPLPTALPTCPKCQFISPLPASMSYFEYFGLPDIDSSNPYAIDIQGLKRSYLQTQRTCHPDIWSQKGERAFSIAAAQSSQLNKAYQTLLSPLLRAEYILAKQGIHEDETETLEDPEFIMEIMDMRQEIEDASDNEIVTRLWKQNKEKIDLAIDQISQMIQERDWQAAKVASIRLKYLLGIDKAAEEKIHRY